MEQEIEMPFDTRRNALLCLTNFKALCLRVFNSPKMFLLLFCVLGILQGAYFTYFIGILSTLEKRYSFGSSVTGIILIADNLGPVLFGICVGHYAKSFHRPQMITFGMMMTVLSSLISCIPYFLFGSEVESTSNISNDLQLCNQNKRFKDCDNVSQNTIAIVIFFFANFFNGLGSMAYYTIGTSYLDDNVKKKHSSLYLGTTFALKITAPSLGFMLSSFSLQYYENPFIDPGFSNNDPKWIGAWWIGFIFFAIFIFIVSVPVTFFPKQMDKVHSEEEIFSEELSFHDLRLSLRKLCKNPILIFHTLSIIFQINGLFAYFVYMPKFMESQYQKTASSANLFSGSVTLVAMGSGVFLGGACIHKVKPRPRFLVGYMLFVEIFAAAALLSAFFLGCETTEVLGNISHLVEPSNQECNLDCACGNQDFFPICDSDRTVYFSPCVAGCHNFTILKDSKTVFENCSCVSPVNLDGSATSGFCGGECKMFLSYLVIVTVAKMLSATVRVGNVLVTLRCVDKKDKGLALGAVEFMISIFATIPFPLFYGHVIDKTCLLWDEQCGARGNCLLYDNELFRHYLHGMAFGFLLLGICCDGVVFIFSSKLKDFYGTDKRDVPENITLGETNQ